MNEHFSRLTLSAAMTPRSRGPHSIKDLIKERRKTLEHALRILKINPAIERNPVAVFIYLKRNENLKSETVLFHLFQINELCYTINHQTTDGGPEFKSYSI